MKKLTASFFALLLFFSFSLTFAQGFSDTAGHWAESDIAVLSSKGLINGISQSEFAPNDNITRAQFVAIMNRAFVNEAADISVENRFLDVGPSDWYYNDVVKAFSLELVNGIKPDYFGADLPITRQDACVLLDRYTSGKFTSDKTESTLTDSRDIQEYAIASVELMYQQNIVRGYPDGSFLPLGKITRAEAAVITKRTLDKTDGEYDTSEWRPTFNVVVGREYLLFEPTEVYMYPSKDETYIDGEYFFVRSGVTPREKVESALNQRYEIYYTLDGTAPSALSNRYDDKPIALYSETPAQFKLSAIILFQDGSKSEVTTMTYSFGDTGRINKVLDDAISEIITPQMTEFEKIMGIHDWIITHTEYDNRIYEPAEFNTPWYLSYTAAGLVYAEKLVCSGYADVFYKLCQRVGINVRVVEGATGKAAGDPFHAWNLVEFDKNWYHVDCTWDDGGGESVGYNFFLKSDEHMQDRAEWRLFYKYHDQAEILPECDSDYVVK